ncbi:MAG TPA: hypothetical protein VFG83_13330 [Kofleriaceae bacterium]|nr:hypothetical protein [Kofleriaceae bacterium]
MTILAQVLVFYVLLVVVNGLWRLLPAAGIAPDLAVIAAVYFGLISQRPVAASTAGAIAVGYIADVLFGAPRGSFALAAGVVCVVCHLVGQRILIGGWLSAALVTAGAAVLADMVVILARTGTAAGSLPGESFGALCLGALMTAALAVPVFRLGRFVDGRISHPEASAGIDIGDAGC